MKRVNGILSGLIAIFVMVLFSFIGTVDAKETYKKIKTCEVRRSDFQYGRAPHKQLDIDEKDSIYYFNEELNEIVVFSFLGQIAQRIPVDRNFKTDEYDLPLVRLKVRNGQVAIFPDWSGKGVYFRDLLKNRERIYGDIAIVGKGRLAFLGGCITNYLSGKVEIKSPFVDRGCEEIKNHNLVINLKTDDLYTVSRGGTPFETEKKYHGGYYFVNLSTVDCKGNVYAVYRRRVPGSDPNARPVETESILIKFDLQLKELASFKGDTFIVNEETEDVYALFYADTIKIEKWSKGK